MLKILIFLKQFYINIVILLGKEGLGNYKLSTESTLADHSYKQFIYLKYFYSV